MKDRISSVRLRHTRFLRAGLSVLLAAAALLLVGLSPAQAAAGRGGESQEYTMRSGGLERTYRLYLPSNYDPSKPLPLVIALHGGFGTGAIMEKQTRLDTLADGARFIVAYPDGFKRSWNAGDQCCDPARKQHVDDIGFMRDLIAKIGSDYKVDPARVYGTGFSNGGMLLHYIACEAPDVFTAIAIHSGTLQNSSCSGRGRVPVLMIHGRKDPRIPWNGGSTRTGGWSDVTYRRPFMEMAKQVAARNGCSSAESVTYQTSPATCETFQGCGANETTWCGLDDVGHQWAGSEAMMPMMLGPSTTRFNASNMIWQFFSRHRRGQQTAGQNQLQPYANTVGTGPGQ
jgi:polyhydroxybutyrate depolymerase